MSRSTDHRRG